MAKEPKPEAIPLPDATCRALEALLPWITENALRLAAEKLNMTDEKVALLIVKAINPHEHFDFQEMAVISGMHRHTVSKLMKEGTLKQ